MARQLDIDMTPLGPGGQTGGSGVVATSLIREISRLEPEWELVLLTSSSSHDQLASLEVANVRRKCVVDETAASPVRVFARRVVGGLPAGIGVQAKNAIWKVRHRNRGQQADLMLCPFTSSNFWRPGVPLVVIVHDLQHVAYSQFFSDEQRLNRDQHLRDAAAHADAIVCVSDFVRQTLREHVPIHDERVVTIHHGLLQRFETSPHAAKPGDYLLYPANFWPHKNHQLLLDAFAEYRRRKPDGISKLVCTGAIGETMPPLRARAPDGVQFAGYVSEQNYAELLGNCAALIYPSLYEGFGMPILEAMALGKPLLCSRIPALVEVAGVAARYFDPTDCDDIVKAIMSLEDDRPAAAARVACGRQRAEQFGDARVMAQSYIDLFERILATK